ncbi:hypothetical protein B0H10DRAFT_2429992 [Mycena sp. CBHHK59/15]|nr:hypothetical protein B0H10DRAFT_2429992 [Mycena sp. CBHHK59/15]
MNPYRILETPDDITIEIFIHCLPAWTCSSFSQGCAPTPLAHSYFEMDRIDATDPHISRFGTLRRISAQDAEALAFIRTWFLRAATQPLSLTLRSPFKILPTKMLSFISTFAPRLRRLELHAEHISPGQLLEVAFPVLQCLAVYISSDGTFDMPLIIAPALREICFRGNLALSRTGRYPLLTRMQCSDTSPASATSRSRTIPRSPSSSSSSRAPDPSPCRPTLTTLHIGIGPHLGAFLECLASPEAMLPHLTALTISCCAAEDVDFAQLSATLESRASVLASFHLTSTMIHSRAGSSLIHSSTSSAMGFEVKIAWGVTRERCLDECETFDL